MPVRPPVIYNESAVSAYVSLVRTAEALHARVSQGLVDEGLTASQFSTLKVLRLRGPLAQKEIAKHLLKTGGNITLVVDNLVRRKLVRRGEDPNDRRIALVEMTPLGEATFDRIYPPHLDRIYEAMSGLGLAQLDQLRELLASLNAAVEPSVCSS